MQLPKSVVIRSTGCYYPERVLTNADLERMVDTSDEWIRTGTGIRERRIAEPSQASSDLAYEAATRALASAEWTAKDTDHIIVATVTADYPFPSCACSLQGKLGATRAAAFDLSAACTGFIYGLKIARSLILAGQAKRILLLGVETLSRIVDYTDRSTCVLFGDGAGAVTLEGSDDPQAGIRSVVIGSDGDQVDLLLMPGGGSRNPSSVDTVEKKMHAISMAGNEVFKIAVRAMEAVSRQAVAEAGLKLDDIDIFIPHQANIRIIDAIAKRLEVPPERLVVTIEKFGNTSAASVPIALDETVRAGRIKPGDHVAMAAFGGGITWGAAVVRWGGR